jgi:hypothetical protein
MQQLVGRYTAGAITGQHLFVECLRMLDPANPGVVLAALPSRLLNDFARFVDDCQPGAMVTTHGLLPSADQVHAATKWLARSGHRVVA